MADGMGCFVIDRDGEPRKRGTIEHLPEACIGWPPKLGKAYPQKDVTDQMLLAGYNQDYNQNGATCKMVNSNQDYNQNGATHQMINCNPEYNPIGATHRRVNSTQDKNQNGVTHQMNNSDQEYIQNGPLEGTYFPGLRSDLEIIERDFSEEMGQVFDTLTQMNACLRTLLRR